MPQSLDHVLLHLVFSTKDRFPCLGESVRPSLHAYLATVARNAGCECRRSGGAADHVHLAIQLSRTITIAALVEELKTSSSKWLKIQSPELSRFAWQRGYGVFSVGPGDRDALLAYIDNQEEHHRTRTFQDEYRGFLAKYEVAYDERYVGTNRWVGLSARRGFSLRKPGALPQADMAAGRCPGHDRGGDGSAHKLPQAGMAAGRCLSGWCDRRKRQRRAFIPAWGNAPGLRTDTNQGLKARPISMPQSLDNVRLHLVFSTKDRFSCRGASVRPDRMAARRCPFSWCDMLAKHVSVTAPTMALGQPAKERLSEPVDQKTPGIGPRIYRESSAGQHTSRWEKLSPCLVIGLFECAVQQET